MKTAVFGTSIMSKVPDGEPEHDKAPAVQELAAVSIVQV
jgi:hypothetical protein